MSFNKFVDEFNERHDFKDPDLEVLQQRFPDVKFDNIPTAWIINIDDMLFKVSKIDPAFITSVTQQQTNLCIETRNNEFPAGKIKDIIKCSYNEICELDKDLEQDLLRRLENSKTSLLN